MINVGARHALPLQMMLEYARPGLCSGDLRVRRRKIRCWIFKDTHWFWTGFLGFPFTRE
jgi:hypothetical protein